MEHKRAYLVSGDPGDVKKIAALNPYHGAVERSRWYTGFNSALMVMQIAEPIRPAFTTRARGSLRGIGKYRRELTAKNQRYNKPEI